MDYDIDDLTSQLAELVGPASASTKQTAKESDYGKLPINPKALRPSTSGNNLVPAVQVYSLLLLA